jgi:hypothetical protein
MTERWHRIFTCDTCGKEETIPDSELKTPPGWIRADVPTGRNSSGVLMFCAAHGTELREAFARVHPPATHIDYVPGGSS